MPVLVRERGFVVRIYGPPREHRPPHVHVELGPSSVAVVRLPIGGRVAKVWKVYGLTDAQVRMALDLVRKHEPLLMAAWEELHGPGRRPV
jgi:hypothetical protein